MVRTYKRRCTNARKGKQFSPYNAHTDADLKNAVKAVKEQGLNQKEASQRYKVPATTIGRHIWGESTTYKLAGRPTMFSVDEENAFVQNVLAMAEWGFPGNMLDLRFLAKRYLAKSGRRTDIFKNNFAGRDWPQYQCTW
ncbi:hypothetical protein QE152_g3755 [Popillia japonica]|uniref:HTH psq-type domain-containing protein n=1 Tax=Popillia japonica TaxID=7064 RepID=A0AAW1N3E2_POPJA